MLEKLHIYIAIISGLLATVVCIILKDNLIETATSILITVAVSFVLGLFVKFYLVKKFSDLEKEKQAQEQEIKNEEESELIEEAVSE